MNPNDVVMVGTLDLHPQDQRANIQKLKETGALIIVFGSQESAIADIGDHLIENGLPAGIVPVMDIGNGNTIGPVAGIANVINKWVFTSELVAALTRQGKMPSLWQSMFVTGAAKRNQGIEEIYYHDDMRIMPIEPRILGRQYLTAVTGYLEKMKANELPKFREAGDVLAAAAESDTEIVAGLIGHFMSSQRRMEGFPNELFTIRENMYGSDQLKDVLDSGDVWLHIGYSYYPVEELTYAKEQGATTIAVFTDGPTEVGEGPTVAPDLSLIDIYIDPYWEHGDAVVEVPDYDTDIIPPSGVLMGSSLWMILGEMLASMD